MTIKMKNSSADAFWQNLYDVIEKSASTPNSLVYTNIGSFQLILTDAVVSDDKRIGVIDWKGPRASIQYEPGDFFNSGNEQEASSHSISLTCPSDECSRIVKTLSNNESVYVSFGILGPSPRDFVLTAPIQEKLARFAKQVPRDIAKAFSLFYSKTPEKEQVQQLEKLIESNPSLVRTRFDGTPLLLLACKSRYGMDSQNLVKFSPLARV